MNRFCICPHTPPIVKFQIPKHRENHKKFLAFPACGSMNSDTAQYFLCLRLHLSRLLVQDKEVDCTSWSHSMRFKIDRESRCMHLLLISTPGNIYYPQLIPCCCWYSNAHSGMSPTIPSPTRIL